MNSWRWTLRAAVCGLALATAIPVAAQHTLPITVTERAGVARSGEYAVFGVPLPRSWDLTDPTQLRLREAAGAPVPAQFEVLSRWGGHPGQLTAPIRWVLVGYLATLPSGGSQTLVLDDGGPGPAPPTAVQIDTGTPGELRVDTGAARFDLATGAAFNLLRQVTVSGQIQLEPLAATEAIRYQPSLGRSVVAGGAPDFTPRATAVAVERSGPLQAVVRVEGSILDDAARAVLDFTARLHFTAGRSDVRLDFTVENNHPVLTGEWEQPTNAHDQGAPNSVYLGALELNLQLAGGAGALTVRTESGVTATGPSAEVELYQDSSGTEHWNAYAGLVGWPGYEASAAPRLQSYCTLPGFEITGAGAPVTGEQALGWLAAARGADGPAALAAVRDFSRNFPKAIAAQPDGRISVDLFPRGDHFNHNLRVGEEKTHTILLAFGAAAHDAAEAERRARALDRPLFGRLAAADYVGSGALGGIPAADASRWPLYERYVRVAFEPNPDFDPDVDDPTFGNGTLAEAVERYNFHGWQDWGDVPLDYEAFGPNQAGQLNLKYWYVYGMLLQFCRSADPAWLDLALPAARHLADTDYLHIPDEGIQHWSHGAYFGHSQHDEPGNANPNRNYNSPSVDLFFGVPDLLLAWHLTGERRFRDVAGEGLEAMLNLSQFSDFNDPLPQRERANLIFGYIEGYRATGDSRWLAALRAIVGATADLSNKGWLTDPAAFGASHPGAYLSTFMCAQVLWTMGRYLDLCAEYGWTDDLGTDGALAAYAGFLLDQAMTEYRPGRAALTHDIFFDGSDPSYLDVNNWALTVADALTYAARHSGEARFLTAAEMFYATGTIDPVWEDDPPVYLSSKDLVNALNWGLVYMQEAGGGAGAAGDLNLDGAVTVVDLAILDHHLAGHLTPGTAPFAAPRSAADLNSDGVVDAADRTALAGRLAGR